MDQHMLWRDRQQNLIIWFDTSASHPALSPQLQAFLPRRRIPAAAPDTSKSCTFPPSRESSPAMQPWERSGSAIKSPGWI